MAERLVVIGGDAAGMSAASQARRRRPADQLEIIAFERSPEVSYAACGEPYFISGEILDLDQLRARTPEQFARADITVNVRHEVVAIDPAQGKVTVRDLDHDRESVVGYDHLVYATGAVPIVPDWEGADLGNIHPLKSLADAAAIRDAALSGVSRAVIVGAGYIGLEVAEALHHRGIETAIVTMGAGVLERTLDPDLGVYAAEEIRARGIPVHVERIVSAYEGRDGKVVAVRTADGETFPADLVVLGIGFRPESALAAASGIPLGVTGAVAVDDHQRTGVANVWSAGDCAEVEHRITGQPVNLHLGTIANRTGRIAGINLGGGDAAFPGALGTAITKVHDLEIARTGLSEAEAAAAGIDAVAATIASTTSAHYWPHHAPMTVKIVAERGTARFLGAQIIGGPGAGKRIDTLATALWAGMDLADLEYADLSYAPPFSPVWDPVQIAARKGYQTALRA